MGRAGALIRPVALVLALAALECAAAVPFEHGLLWRVTKPGVPASYVFGTIHLADPRALQVPPPVERALAQCRHYAMETPFGPGHAQQMLEAAQYDDARRLRDKLAPATYARVWETLAGRGIAPHVIERMRPWAALANLAVTPAGYGHVTLDERLLAMARAQGLRFEPLEGTEEHVSVLEGIPEDSQLAMLAHVVEHREWLTGRIEPVLQAWLRRDLVGIRRANEATARHFPEMARHYDVFQGHVVRNRSVVMAHRLTLPLRRGRVFVAVGAAHLEGRDGLLALIRGQGYRIARVY